MLNVYSSGLIYISYAVVLKSMIKCEFTWCILTLNTYNMYTDDMHNVEIYDDDEAYWWDV